MQFRVKPSSSGPTATVRIGIPTALQAAGSEISLELDYFTSPDASAIQWLDPVATKGGVYPYIFTQSQAIHARSMFPSFDCPGLKCPYSAKVRVPAWCTVLMSAVESRPSEPGPIINGKDTRLFFWDQSVPVPAYLVALAAGNLASSDLSHRVRIWAEPEVVGEAAWEFAQTEDFLQAAEAITGCPYQWNRYDILCLPPSFPYGGIFIINFNQSGEILFHYFINPHVFVHVTVSFYLVRRHGKSLFDICHADTFGWRPIFSKCDCTRNRAQLDGQPRHKCDVESLLAE